MSKHVTVVGAIQIGFSVIGLMGAVAIFVALSFARGFVGDEDAGQIVLKFLSISLPVLVGFLASAGLIGGIGVLLHKNWARYLVIVVSAIGCLNIPFGTAKGVYSIWVLIQDDTVRMFNQQNVQAISQTV